MFLMMTSIVEFDLPTHVVSRQKQEIIVVMKMSVLLVVLKVVGILE